MVPAGGPSMAVTMEPHPTDRSKVHHINCRALCQTVLERSDTRSSGTPPFILAPYFGIMQGRSLAAAKARRGL